MKITKEQLAPPYRPQDLMFLDLFISFCRDLGVATDEAELEYYEQEQLLIPALRIKYGYGPMKKILAVFQEGQEPEWKYVQEDDITKFQTTEVDPQIYYMHGSVGKITHSSNRKPDDFLDQLKELSLVSVDGSDWIEDYREQGLVIEPSLSPFQAWATYKMGPTFSTSVADFEDAAATLYSPLQIYALRYIQNRRSITIKGAALFRSPEDWTKSGGKLTKIFSKAHSNEDIQKGLFEMQKFHALVNQLLDLYDHRQAYLFERLRVLEKEHRKSLSEREASKEAVAEINDELPLIDSRYQPLVEESLVIHGFSLTNLTDRFDSLSDISALSRSRLSSNIRYNYLQDISAKHLLKEYPHKLVHHLMWSVYVLEPDKHKGIGIKPFLLNTRDHHCIICGKVIGKPRKKQTTCGDAECKREYNTISVASGRAGGVY